MLAATSTILQWVARTSPTRLNPPAIACFQEKRFLCKEVHAAIITFSENGSPRSSIFFHGSGQVKEFYQSRQDSHCSTTMKVQREAAEASDDIDALLVEL